MNIKTSEKRHITNIGRETEDITVDFTDIKLIRDYYEQLYTDKKCQFRNNGPFSQKNIDY